MGNGVPNGGPCPHYEGQTLVGYIYFYHDQQVTGNDWKPSPQMTITAYTGLRAAAFQGQTEFDAEWAQGAWASFSAFYTGIDLGAARKGVKLLATP